MFFGPSINFFQVLLHQFFILFSDKLSDIFLYVTVLEQKLSWSNLTTLNKLILVTYIAFRKSWNQRMGRLFQI